MASMRDIKRRKESIQSTQQITKAMKLVSTVKLQRAKARAESAKPYFVEMVRTVRSILGRSQRSEHPFLTYNGSDKKAVIMITSNRGLAGGYNNNVVKKIEETGWEKDKVLIYGVGRKGIETLVRRGYTVVSDDSEVINEPLFSDAAEIGDKVLEAYSAGEVGEIWLAFTGFKNTVVHVPTLIRLLPVDPGITERFTETAASGENVSGGTAVSGENVSAGTAVSGENASGETAASRNMASGETASGQGSQSGKEAPMNYEPTAEEALSMIIPKYINSTIYGAFIEAVASENGARMQAMDNATSNAEEMISSLSLAYNRARQGAITQELTEIISGAEALN